jgi:hypothetical protein
MKKTLKLDPLLREILVDQAVQQFTVTELRDLYRSSYQRSTGKEIDASEARKWLYRRIYKMTAQGYLDKIYSEDGSLSAYRLTEKFNSVKIKDASSCHLDSLDAVKESASGMKDKIQDILLSLKDKAKQYQVDLNASISETEEYKLLYESYPSLKLQLEAQYELSKNNSSKLLGQLTATQKIISQLSTAPSKI